MSTHSPALTEEDLRAINISKALAADAVEKAGSGHPGTAISLAGVAYLLYQYEMTHDPADTRWLGRACLIKYNSNTRISEMLTYSITEKRQGPIATFYS